MNINDVTNGILEYNKPTKIDYKKIKVKRIKSNGGIVVTQYFYNGTLIMEKL